MVQLATSSTSGAADQALTRAWIQLLTDASSRWPRMDAAEREDFHHEWFGVAVPGIQSLRQVRNARRPGRADENLEAIEAVICDHADFLRRVESA